MYIHIYIILVRPLRSWAKDRLELLPVLLELIIRFALRLHQNQSECARSLIKSFSGEL